LDLILKALLQWISKDIFRKVLGFLIHGHERILHRILIRGMKIFYFSSTRIWNWVVLTYCEIFFQNEIWLFSRPASKEWLKREKHFLRSSWDFGIWFWASPFSNEVTRKKLNCMRKIFRSVKSQNNYHKRLFFFEFVSFFIWKKEKIWFRKKKLLYTRKILPSRNWKKNISPYRVTVEKISTILSQPLKKLEQFRKIEKNLLIEG